MNVPARGWGSARTRDRSTGVLVVAISGTAGVGKSALAVHWAHRVRDTFPDGQLYVNLRGFDPSGAPASPAEALRGFLDTFGAQPAQVPNGTEAQAALYRSLLAGKRVLILLDNARDAQQVRPLLPGTADCLVIVTSRDKLSGLVATDGAHPLVLDLLDPEESRRLLARRLGTDRIAAEREAVDQIVDRCVGLPLALAIVAARAATEAWHPLAFLARELSEPQTGLAMLDAGDPISDLRRVFSWSYRTLSPPAARMFRLLGLPPGPEISTTASASLAGTPVVEARSQLAELSRAHLITQFHTGRHAFHDLLRAYAVELVHSDESPGGRHAALVRLLDHYLGTLTRAADVLQPGRPAVTVVPPQEPVTLEAITTLDEAMSWFMAEHRALVAMVRLAAANGLDNHAWQLAWNLRDFLDRRRLWAEQATVQQAGLDAAVRVGDRAAQAHAHRSLGRTYVELLRVVDAEHHYRQAFELFSTLGDDIGRARIHMSLGMLARSQGHVRESLDLHQQALALFEHADHVPGRSNAMNNIAMNYLELGESQRALGIAAAALSLVQEVGDRWGEASTYDTLGSIHHRLGQPTQAIDCYRRTLTLVRQVGDRYHEALTLRHLADAYDAAGDRSAAVATLRDALTILDELDHPDAAAVRASLEQR